MTALDVPEALLGGLFAAVVVFMIVLAAEIVTNGALSRWRADRRLLRAVRRKLAAVRPRTAARKLWAVEMKRIERHNIGYPVAVLLAPGESGFTIVDGADLGFADEVARAEATFLSRLSAHERAALARSRP